MAANGRHAVFSMMRNEFVGLIRGSAGLDAGLLLLRIKSAVCSQEAPDLSHSRNNDGQIRIDRNPERVFIAQNP
jgi:hypothetical protein